MKVVFILVLWMTCAVASAQDLRASGDQPAPLDPDAEALVANESLETQSFDNTKLVAVPEPSISLLVATGGFFYLMRWRSGRRR